MVATGELAIDSQGRMWRLRKRHGRGVKPGGGYYNGTTTSPCKKVRAEFQHKQGYLQIVATRGGKKFAAMAHRVIWTHLNGPIPPGLTINHKNGKKADNRPANLELMTMKQQRRHALEVLNVARNRPQGSKHPKTHLTEADVVEMRRLRTAGTMVKDVASKFNMTRKATSAILTRKTWRHI